VIKIDRNKIAKPEFFHSKEYEHLKQEISEFYTMQKSSRAQRTFSIQYFPDSVFDTLLKLFNDKCAYCESYLTHGKSNYFQNYDRFRPTNNAQSFDSKEIDFDHYWWLTYQWENIYTCCNNCSRFKSNLFPVQGERAPIETIHQDISEQENAFLIDPCLDSPSQFFTFNFNTFEIIPRKEKELLFFSKIKFTPLIGEMIKQKAEATIQILGLNRRDLTYQRQNIALEIENDVRDLLDSVKGSHAIAEKWNEVLKGTSKKDHLGANIFESLQFPLKEDPVDGLTRDTTKPPKVEKAIFDEKDGEYYASILKNIYLDKIVLHNFKCFADLTLQLPDYSDDTSSEPWLVFLGENGVGKSSVLKAIALALMGQNYLNTLDLTVNDLLKYNETSGFIQVYGKGNNEFFEITFNNTDNKITANIENPPAFIIGYGSTRLLPIGNLQPEKNHPNYLKVKNLFNASISLSDAKDWFLNAEQDTFDQVSITLKNLLLLDDLDAIERDPQEKQISIKYDKTKDTVDINHLSDGYKSIFAIAIDMIYTLSKENVVYELAEGIVLVDEIGTHLHPRWKMEIVERLRKTFPKIQFIITTHEPLCLRGLKEHEVVVLKRDDENAIIAISDLPNPSTLRIDQLLKRN